VFGSCFISTCQRKVKCIGFNFFSLAADFNIRGKSGLRSRTVVANVQTIRIMFMKILLVNPDTPNTFWSLKNALRFISKKSMLPPLGLLTVAAMLPKEWEKRLVDMPVTKLRDRDILWADYVFITGMFIQRHSAKHVIDRCKKLGKPIVAGGPLFTMVPEDFPEVDYFVLNEAEITLPHFLKDLANGNPQRLYKAKQFADLKDSPTPLLELADMRHYAVMPVQYSRGCPFNCYFCDVTTMFGHQMRTKTKEQILQELDRIYSAGWRGSVFIVDDNFIGNKKKLKDEILPAIVEWMEKKKYPFFFNTQTSINLADDEELMRLMVDAGFDCVFVGIESASEECLTECNKVQNTRRNLVDCVKKIQSFGMQVQGGFILGFDSDKGPIFENLIKFIQQSGIVTAMVGLLNAPRGTQLYKRLMQENRLLKNPTGDNTDFSMNFVPKMRYEELIDGYRTVVKTIYSHKFHYERILTFLKNYRPSPNLATRNRYQNIKAFIKSIWLLGIVNRGRIYYWKLIFWSLRRPQYLNATVTLLIYGFHFRKVFDSFQTT
jgi:radical SAM superfamily enzyme YgiQ (UPF0313 family)